MMSMPMPRRRMPRASAELSEVCHASYDDEGAAFEASRVGHYAPRASIVDYFSGRRFAELFAYFVYSR